MAMIINNNFEFNDTSNVLDFMKPLLIEGYSASINKVHKEYTCLMEKINLLLLFWKY